MALAAWRQGVAPPRQCGTFQARRPSDGRAALELHHLRGHHVVAWATLDLLAEILRMQTVTYQHSRDASEAPEAAARPQPLLCRRRCS